jgi:hypothetical protein
MFSQKKASSRVTGEAERAKYNVARAAGFVSIESVNRRATRIIGVLVKLMLTSGSAGAGYTAATAKLTAFNAEGTAIMAALASFETIDGLLVGYLAEIAALETVQDVIDWEAQERVWE